MTRKRIGKLFTPTLIISSIILALILFIALFGSSIAPYDPNEINLSNTYAGVSAEHWFGTDQMGRDMFSRILVGARSTILNAVLVVLFADLIGVPLGLICGYYSGFLDTIIMRVWDVLMAFPPLILAFIFVAVFGRGEYNSVLAVGIVYIPMISRLTRSTVLAEKTKTYVEAAKNLGYSDTKIIFQHIFPNCVPTLMAEFALDIGYAMLSLASLSFLGLGVQAPKCDWGTILQSGMSMLFNAPLVALIPGFCIVITTVALNMMADSIQMYLDPNQRRLPNINNYLRKEAKSHAR